MIPEPQSPEYFLDSFPRDAFPQYSWTKPPATMPRDAWTTETTHRDGQQGGLPLTTEHSVQIYDILCRFTGTSGAIRQAEFSSTIRPTALSWPACWNATRMARRLSQPRGFAPPPKTWS